MEIKTGLEHTERDIVTDDKCAKAVGSGTLLVYATPMMLALMEKSAYLCVEPYLSEGQTTVGTKLSVDHVSATPINMEVYAKSTLEKVDGRKLVFKVEAFDEKGLIGKGEHERFIVDTNRFIDKANAKNT